MDDSQLVPNLTIDGCRARQARLREVLRRLGVDAALLTDRRYVYYFTGFWRRSIYSPLALIELEGPTTASIPHLPSMALAADETIVYESNRLGTLVEDQWRAAIQPLESRLRAIQRLGVDFPSLLDEFDAAKCTDLRPVISSLRRRKDEDEVAMIRCAILATESAYRIAFDVLRAGMTEVELFALMSAAVAKAVGEPVGEMGNDFQINSPGGLPRRRPAENGEMAVLDLAVVVRGYTSDLTRSFVVGRRPSDVQMMAHERLMDVLGGVEAAIRANTRCRDLYAVASAQLDGYHGWSFGHHLGHGIGLSPHEAPRINPHWNDAFEIGDVFTLEPGLYGDDLRAGLRIEHDYYLAADGLKRLSTFPTDLA